MIDWRRRYCVKLFICMFLCFSLCLFSFFFRFYLFIFSCFSCAILILNNNMFVVVALYCVQLLSEVICLNHSFYLFSLLKLFTFTCIAPFFLESKSKWFSKGWTSVNQKNHEWPWSSIVCLLCGSSIVSSFFLQNHVILSFAIAFVSYLLQFSWQPLLDFYGVSLRFL